jgi:hypothetical protein
MDSWKGEKLHGADRRLTRAQLEAVDCVVRMVSEVRTATGGKGPAWVKLLEALAPGR